MVRQAKTAKRRADEAAGGGGGSALPLPPAKKARPIPAPARAAAAASAWRDSEEEEEEEEEVLDEGVVAPLPSRSFEGGGGGGSASASAFPAEAQPLVSPPHALPVVRIEGMSRTLDEFPHVLPDRACREQMHKVRVAEALLKPHRPKGAAAKAADREAEALLLTPHALSLSEVQLRELHYEESQEAPAELVPLLQARGLLQKPAYYTADNPLMGFDEACEHIRHNPRARLPLLTAQLEQQQMMQAGTWYVPVPGRDRPEPRVFPPCCYGNQCIGQFGMIRGLTEAITFTRAMPKEQWHHFLRTGEAPRGSWPCVLCHRYHSHNYILQRHAYLRSGHEPRAGNPNEVYQFWYTLVDQPGGYKRDFVIRVRDHEILVAPLAVVHYELMRATRANPDSPWHVLQTDMMFDTDTRLLQQQPHVGSTVQDFCNGAGRSTTSSSPTGDASRARAPLAPRLTACSVSASASPVSPLWI